MWGWVRKNLPEVEGIRDLTSGPGGRLLAGSFQADWRQLEQGFWPRDIGSGAGVRTDPILEASIIMIPIIIIRYCSSV